MGPPKIPPREKLRYSERTRRYHCFEYRWDGSAGAYYLFNPYTGETIAADQVEMPHRGVSLWAKPDLLPCVNAETVDLIPEFYLSRRWGRRRFHGWESHEAAAVQLTAAARGFLARLSLRRYFAHRYVKKFDSSSGYFYFLDQYDDDPSTNTSWYKPSLAFPDDIREAIDYEPHDYLRGERFSKQDHMRGPLVAVSGLSKHDIARVPLDEFLIPNPIRTHVALRHYDEVDWSSVRLHDILMWFEGEKIQELHMNEFHLIRAAIANNNWRRVLDVMRAHPENVLLQIYAFHSFAKSDLPLNFDGTVDEAALEAMDACVEIIRSENQENLMLKLFAMRAFHNIVGHRAGRMDYLDATTAVMEQGEARAAAVEAFLMKRLNIFNMQRRLELYLQRIQNHEVIEFEKGAQVGTTVTKPLPRAVEIVEESLRCLSVLAHEQECKEPMSLLVTEPTLFAINICQEDAGVVEQGLRLLYNLCYRCESAHQILLNSCNQEEFLSMIHHHHSGDPNVMRHCRRFELTLTPNGWRGNNEEAITQEMKDAVIPSFESQYGDESDFKDSGYYYEGEAEQADYYPDDAKLAIENDENNSKSSDMKGDFQTSVMGKSQSYFGSESKY